MNAISGMPPWVADDEAVEIINSRIKHEPEIKASDLYRYVLYGKLTLSIYFNPP